MPSTSISEFSRVSDTSDLPLREKLSLFYEDLIFFDGFDDAIVGVVESYGNPPVVCYDRRLILDILEADMDPEDALEYFEFNVAAAYMGETTPAILERFEDASCLFGGAPSEPPGDDPH